MFRTKVYFYIIKKRINRNGECPIYCRITFQNERTSFSTSLKVRKDKWNRQRQQVNESSELDSAINNKLEQIKSHIYFHHSHLLDQGNVFSVEHIKAAFINS